MTKERLLVIVPSRGRPDNVRRLQAEFDHTANWGGVETDLLFGFDDDDPSLFDLFAEGDPGIMWNAHERLGLCGTLNRLAVDHAGDYQYIGFMGDDHVPRTVAWDEIATDTLRGLGTGICYGDDLFQHAELPTAVFMTADIVQTLGYMAPPVLRHMWIDNVWKAWGQSIGKLVYLPDMVIEHMHPQAGGKAPMDDRYADVWPLLDEERPAWERYRDEGDLARDVGRLRRLVTLNNTRNNRRA
jgi:hypothetical protein